MSITNKKIDALRRLLLGNLYQECKDNPMGVSRKQLEDHLEKIKGEGCIGDCSVDEFVKTCQLKTHYPTCVDGNYRSCVENIGERSTGVDKVYYNQYKNSKMFENEPDTDEEEEEGEVCNVCSLSGDDDIGMPVEQMSCGHHSHINCLIKIAQQKGRDNAECPECRKEFPLTEVPVPVRTLEQRQADSMRRAQFNASQMGFNVRNDFEDDEEETEEDRLSQSIESHIGEHQVNEAIEGIRNFYTREIRRTILSRYIKAWLNKIKREIGQISFDDIKRLVDAIFETNIISLSNRLIAEFYWLYEEEETNEEIKEKIMYIIKTIIKHYIRQDGDDDMFSFFLQILMTENLFMFLEEVMRVCEREGNNERLRDSFNIAIEELDVSGIDDRIKDLITNWFNSHNYQAPSFESNVAQQLTDAIIGHIENRYFMGAEAGIEEFYEREIEEIPHYVPDWIDALLYEIKTEELEMDNVVSLVDTIFARGRLLTLSGRHLKEIRNIMRLGDSQKRQCIYIVMRVSLILIKDFPDEETLGLLIESIIKVKALTLLKVVMKVADENNREEVLKRHILDVIGYLNITDSQPQNVINEWFRSHNLPLPIYRREESEEEEDEEEEDEEEEVNPTRRLNFDDDEDDRPLQISRLTPPHERVHRGRWFNRVR